nr:PREDICTED: uncharacterized protein LOC105677895 [Linepithema humile]
MASSVEECLAKLKQRKRILKASLTRSENFFKDINSSDVDIDEIELRISKAEETWKSLSEVQMEIGLLDDNASDDELDKELEGYENKFLHLKLIATKLIKSHIGVAISEDRLDQVGQGVSDNSQRNTRNNNNNFVRLPKIELPTFSGLYKDWYAFFDVFNSLIHSNGLLNDVQRFHYLKSALKGEAAETISSLEISGLNYENAWTRLQERYDNQRLIIQTHIKAIFDLPIVRKENGTAIRQVLDGVLKHTRALQALKRPTQQ